MAGLSRLNRAILRGLEDSEGRTRPGTGRGNRGDTPEIAEAQRRAAAERVRDRENRQNASTTQRRSSITGAPVSMADIRAADNNAKIRQLTRQIEGMPEGSMRRRLMEAVRDRQQQIEDARNERELAQSTARAGTAAGARRRVNQPNNISLSRMESDRADREFSKGGMAKKRKGYNKGGMARKGYAKGGYANCGASVPPDGKRRK